MPLRREQTEALVAALRERDWKRNGDFIYGPRESMWLLMDAPWQGDLADFVERMESRVSRIAQNQVGDFEQALDDTRSLLAALRSLTK